MPLRGTQKCRYLFWRPVQNRQIFLLRLSAFLTDILCVNEMQMLRVNEFACWPVVPVRSSTSCPILSQGKRIRNAPDQPAPASNAPKVSPFRGHRLLWRVVESSPARFCSVEIEGGIHLSGILRSIDAVPNAWVASQTVRSHECRNHLRTKLTNLRRGPLEMIM